MRGPFLRVYVGVALTVLAVQAFSLVQMQREIEAEADRRVVSALAPGVQMMQRRLRRHRGPIPTRLLEEVAANHGLDATVLRDGDPALDLTDDEMRTIREDELALIRRGSDRYVYSALRSNAVLRLGPMANLVPRQRVAHRLLQTGAVLIAIGGILFALLRPFERRLILLANAARKVGAGAYDTRVGDVGDDAIGEVATAFDGMASRVEHTIGEQRELLRAVSHELRTPIARLLFLADELRNDGGDRSDRLDRVDASLSEMRDLVDELLSFTRLSDGGGLSLASADLEPALTACIESAMELRSDIDVRTNLVPIVAVFDERLLIRAVTNLLSNAVRHATSSVHLSAHQDDLHTIIEVFDDGDGIPRPDQTRIFEPFVRLDDSRRRDSGGAGLGLAIVARIAASHGGTVRAVDTPDVGAKFVLKWPTSGPKRT